MNSIILSVKFGFAPMAASDAMALHVVSDPMYMYVCSNRML